MAGRIAWGDRFGAASDKCRNAAPTACAIAFVASLATVLLGVVFGLIGPASEKAWAQTREMPSKKNPVQFSADEVTYDKTLEIVTLRGNVQLFQDNRILTADVVSYNQRADIATASGHVVLMEPTGEVAFSDYMEITGDLKNGVARNIRMLLADNSRFAANGGTLVNGNRTTLTKAVFSPCNLCEKDPSRPPLWQLKADQAVHDSTTKDITYRDVTLEMWGIPVFYTPYFSQPDPSVKRRTGLLAPEFGLSSRLGFSVTMPYYWSITDSEDLTFFPRYMSKEGGALGVEYRRRFDNGRIDLLGTGTNDSNGDWLGSIEGKGQFELNDVWRAGFDVQRTTGKTYLRKYGYDSPPFLQSDAYLEGFGTRSYASINNYVFQEMRTDISNRTLPVVAPLMQLDMVGDPDKWGGHYMLQAQAANIFRDTGTDSSKLSVKAGWTKPYIGGWGDVWQFTGTVQGDVYDVHKVVDPLNPNHVFTGTVTRVVPQGTIDWRWPFTRQSSEHTYQVVEPIASLSLAPTLGRQWRIPNEDSVDSIFDETNLFSANRFTGSDRLEGGQRLSYGVRFGLFGTSGGATNLFLGQTYRFNKHSPYVDNKNDNERLSDYITALSINPGQYWDGFARLRFDKDTLKLRQTDLITTVGPQAFRLSLNYIYITDNLTGLDSFGSRQEINLKLTSKIDENWTIGGVYSHDLESGHTRLYGAQVTYEDECFLFTLDAQRRLYHDQVLRPDSRVLFQIVFKQFTSVRSRVY